MDIKEALLAEHSKSQCKKIVAYIGTDKRKFSELMGAFFEEEYRMTQRASWPMGSCVQENPGLIVPYFGKLLSMLQRPHVHNAVPRNIIKLLQDIELPRRYHGKIMTICFDYISSDDTPVAIKAFSLTVLNNLSKEYPEIRPELKLVIEERWDHETAAFKSRAKKILKQM